MLSVWNACMSLWYMFGSNGIGDGLKNGITKSNVINCLCVLCWERVEVLLNHYWCNFIFVWLWTVQCYENNHLLIFLCELVICIILRHWLWQVLCALRKNGYLRGCSISSDVSRAVMDTIFRGTYRAPLWLPLSRVLSCAATDAWTDMSPMGSGLRDSGCVITRSDMHHYTWHYIPLHCTYLSLVNLILCFADLVNAFLWNLWLMNTELVLEDIKFGKLLLLRICNLARYCC